MAKVVKKEIYWDPPADPDVTAVRMYVEEDPATPDYNSPMLEFAGTTTTVTVPDETPGFFDKEAVYNIGISFVDDQGNESDITVVSSPFDFIAPSAPSGVGVRAI